MLYLHVGLHKTGTTYLQSVVFPNWSGIRYLRNLTVENFLRIDSEETVLASREGLSGPALGSQAEKLAFLKRLSRMFPEARILISFRPHAAYVNALYSQYLRYGGTLTLPEFFDIESDRGMLKHNDIQFRPYIEAIEEYWGRTPFVFLLSEIMRQPDRLADDLGALVGNVPPRFEAVTRRSRNASLGAVQANTLRRLNITCGVHLHRDGSTRPYRTLRRLSIDPPHICQRWSAIAKSMPMMNSELADRINQHFRDDWHFVEDRARQRPSHHTSTPGNHTERTPPAARR